MFLSLPEYRARRERTGSGCTVSLVRPDIMPVEPMQSTEYVQQSECSVSVLPAVYSELADSHLVS